MSFKTLENRFNENVNKIYAGAKGKFENGKSSNGRNDDPLIVRKPGDGYWNFAESRSTPIISAATDVKRLTLFTASKRGILFLAKQQLLQTGNTFESTRILNPAFHISNAVPFIHTKRAVDIPITGAGIARSLLGNNALTRKIFGSGGQLRYGSVDSNDRGELTKIGQLQEETYNKLIDKQSVKSLIKKIPVIGQIVSGVTAKRSVGDSVVGIKNYYETRPELSKFGGYIMATQILSTRFQSKKYTTSFNPSFYPTPNEKYFTYLSFSNQESDWTVGQLLNDYVILRRANIKRGPLEKTKIQFKSNPTLTRSPITEDVEERWSKSLDRISVRTNTSAYVDGLVKESTALSSLPRAKVLTSDKDPIPNAPLEGVSYIKYFRYGVGTVKQASAKEILDSETTVNARELAKDKGRISYIRDDSNKQRVKETKNTLISKEAYNRIESNFDDPIVVSFAMGTDGHVRFRAYIRDLQQAANPQYNPLQYIGRMEKFIYYTGVQREVSFKLGLIAFSKDELDGMWRRVNYLTGMAYPYGFNKGIFQPNIIRMTIGNVYVNQPGYITSLNTNFSEITETWELDSGKQVPISATMTMNFTLIEKASRVADSPFYGITEGLDGFSNQIPTPQPQGQAATQDPKTSPPSATTPTPISVNSIRNLFPNPFGNRETATPTPNPLSSRPSTSGPFRGFGGGGGFSGGGGGSSF